MTYFPQLNPAALAKRLKLGGSVVVAIRSEGDSQPVRAKLHELSATGGLLVLSNALEQGAFVEVPSRRAGVKFEVWPSFCLQDGNRHRAAFNPSVRCIGRSRSQQTTHGYGIASGPQCGSRPVKQRHFAL